MSIGQQIVEYNKVWIEIKSEQCMTMAAWFLKILLLAGKFLGEYQILIF